VTSIFIVDDEFSIRLFYRTLLKRHGYEIIATARNGFEAVTLYKCFTNKPDVIIMDYQMPVENGLEAAKEILKLNPKQKIIFATGNNLIKQEVFSIGVVDLLIKPFNFQILIESIKKAIEK